MIKNLIEIGTDTIWNFVSSDHVWNLGDSPSRPVLSDEDFFELSAQGQCVQLTDSNLIDLQTDEERLTAPSRSGWLLANMNDCLWAFSMPRWERGFDSFMKEVLS